ncbi:MAG TPA: hypothetical protein VFY06_00915 [Verrucomicrobiae bacterium]|nr:hypothetical protein [Verrucomicrobiae bacterium]
MTIMALLLNGLFAGLQRIGLTLREVEDISFVGVKVSRTGRLMSSSEKRQQADAGVAAKRANDFSRQ